MLRRLRCYLRQRTVGHEDFSLALTLPWSAVSVLILNSHMSSRKACRWSRKCTRQLSNEFFSQCRIFKRHPPSHNISHRHPTSLTVTHSHSPSPTITHRHSASLRHRHTHVTPMSLRHTSSHHHSVTPRHSCVTLHHSVILSHSRHTSTPRHTCVTPRHSVAPYVTSPPSSSVTPLRHSLALTLPCSAVFVLECDVY